MMEITDLTFHGVSILTEVDGQNHRCAYANNPAGREEIKNNLPAEMVEKILDVWGDPPTREQILQYANIPEMDWTDCYISDDGMIFTPEKDENGKVILTGEERYNQWIEAQNQVPEEPDALPDGPPTQMITPEQEQIAALALKQAQQESIIAALMLQVAQGGGVENV